MAVLNIEDSYEEPYVTREEVKTSVIFNSEENITSLTQYIAGGKWSVTYYNQVLGENTEPVMPDVEIPHSQISYYKIKDLIIHIDTPIANDDVKDISGNGTVNAGFIPFYGDAFTAKVLGGRIGLFIITEVTKKIYNNHDIFDITFKLDHFIDSDPTLYNDLNAKVSKDYVYNKDFIKDYNAPIIIKEEYVKQIDIKKAIPEMVSYYLDNFINDRVDTIALPTMDSVYFDQYLSDFIYRVVSQEDDIRLLNITRFTTGYIDDINETIFDILVNRRNNRIPRLINDLKFYLTPVPSTRPQLSNIYYAGIAFIIRDEPDSGAIPNIIENPDYEDRDIETFEEPIGSTERKYVFTEAFYKHDLENCGYFERLVWSYLEDSNVDDVLFTKAIENYYEWCTLDQYYFIPILVLITRWKSQHIY